jgi:membrane-bound ClpP family serine protease
MNTAIFLRAAALIMIYMEFFLPGAIMGTAGALLFVTSIVIAAQATDSIAVVLLFLLVSLAGLVAVIKLALYQIRHSGSANTIYLDDDQEGYQSPTFDSSAVGKRGTAASVMAPSGHIKVEGKKHQAVSKTGFIKQGAPIEVVEGKGAYLVVKELKEKTNIRKN